MIRPSRRLPVLAGAAVLALSAGALALAQPTPAPRPEAGPAPHTRPLIQRHITRTHDWRASRVKALHDALNIRSDQETAWSRFQEAMQPSEVVHFELKFETEADEALTTPERLDRMVQQLAERQAKLAQRAKAVKDFYAVLDANQRRTFDALARLGPGRLGLAGLDLDMPLMPMMETTVGFDGPDVLMFRRELPEPR